jgi:hypothetical protein
MSGLDIDPPLPAMVVDPPRPPLDDPPAPLPEFDPLEQANAVMTNTPAITGSRRRRGFEKGDCNYGSFRPLNDRR